MGAADNAHVVLSTVDRGVSSKYVIGRDLFNPLYPDFQAQLN